MPRSRSLGRTLTTLAVAGGMAVVAAPAAQAVTSAHVFCETGGGQFYCEVSHDGVAPLTITWTINGSPAPGQNNKTWIGLFPCGQPRPEVTATVTDATGSASDYATFVCNYGPWP